MEISLAGKGDDSAFITGTSSKVILYEEIDGTRHEINLPLTLKANINEMAEELGLPKYVDLQYFPIQSAIVTLWACVKAPELHKLYPEAFEKRISDKPIPALLFGGGAIKILCEHANGKGPLARKINDTDFIVPKKSGSNFLRILLSVDKAFGTQLKFFKTQGDVAFNAMRQGRRYRARTINGVTEDGLPTVTRVDIFCDSIDLRHKIEVKEFEKYRENLYTIGLEPLILSKCQFITDASKDDLGSLREVSQEFRILPYDCYSPDRIVVGMEERDVRDVCAIFLDHPIGQGPREIDPSKMLGNMRAFSGIDRKLSLTVTLNLRNLVERTELLKRWLDQSDIATVSERIRELLQHLPKVEEKWSKPWWNTAVETP
jgi:hypothetical protein